MGNQPSKSTLRDAIVFMSICAEPIKFNDEKFWNRILSQEDNINHVSISVQEIRMLRDGSPDNFAILIAKLVQQIYQATKTLCNTQGQQLATLNCVRVLTKLIPCMFEDKEWSDFLLINSVQLLNLSRDDQPQLSFPKKRQDQTNFKSYLPKIVNGAGVDIVHDTQDESDDDNEDQSYKNDHIPTDEYIRRSEALGDSILKTLVLSICDLLFCPEFTVLPNQECFDADNPPDDLSNLESSSYVWQVGVGFSSDANCTRIYDKNRIEILKLLLVIMSETLYNKSIQTMNHRNYSIEVLTKNDNRHALPLFTSILNTIFNYRRSGYGGILFEDSHLELVQLCAQIMIVTLDYQYSDSITILDDSKPVSKDNQKNLFIEYMSRIHKLDDLMFLIKGFARLLNDQIERGYIVNTNRYINLEQEMLILYWHLCNSNQNFIKAMLMSPHLPDIVIPILVHMNLNFQNQSNTAIIHLGLYNLLFLSGQRNFAIRLNKIYKGQGLPDIPSFEGSHADLMIILFHKLILYGFNIYELFEYMTTIIVNISPYLKGLSMVASRCLVQLFEIFSSAEVLFTEPNYHQLVHNLIESFNNIIQYQFDANSHLICTIYNKRESFMNLKNLPTSENDIKRVIKRLLTARDRQNSNDIASKKTKQGHPEDDKYDKDLSTCSPDNKVVKATISMNLNDNQSKRSVQKAVSLVRTPIVRNVITLCKPSEFDCEKEVLLNKKSSPSNHYFVHDQFKLSLNQKTSETQESGKTKNILDLDDMIQLSPKKYVEPNREIPFLQDEESEALIQRTERATPIIEYSNRPNSEYLKSWKASLPLDTTVRMIEALGPQLQRHLNDTSKSAVLESEIIKFVQMGTLVGLLPVPHPILIRKYQSNNDTKLWFRVCTWAIVYVKSNFWSDTTVRLIKVHNV